MYTKLQKHFSIFMLMARSSIYKIFLLMFAMIATETVLFYSALSCSLEDAIFQSRIARVFGIFFVLLTALLCYTGYETSSKQDYTLMRLSVPEFWVFLWQSIYNTICYVIFWSVQLLLVIGFCYLYMHKHDYVVSNTQMLFLAFYRSPFIHSLFPFEEIVAWIKNIMLIVSLGICSAHYPLAHRKGKHCPELILLLAITILLFVQPFGKLYYCVSAIAGAFFCSYIAISHAHKEVYYES